MNLYDISYFLLCFIYDIYVYTCPTLANVTSVLNTSFSYTHICFYNHVIYFMTYVISVVKDNLSVSEV